MGKQKKGFNWKARQQGGTLETDVVARLVAFMALICFKIKANFLATRFHPLNSNPILCPYHCRKRPG